MKIVFLVLVCLAVGGCSVGSAVSAIGSAWLSTSGDWSSDGTCDTPSGIKVACNTGAP